MIAGKLAARDVFLLGIVLAAALIVNPLRELLTWDDGWAYARSVENLLTTGRYQLDQWSAANMPVQIGVAAGLAKVFGYSLTLLRLTTLIFLIVLLLSFRRLAEACGCRPADAMVLALALFASPVAAILSFTFMSDIQFLAWLTLSLALYKAGLAQRRSLYILAGSVAAAGSIGTRQFGIALLAGWVIAVALSSRTHRPSLATFLLATGLPSLLAGWQLWMGAGEPNVTQAYRLAEQHVLLTQPIHALAKEAIWRSAVWVQYSALYLLPLMPLVVGAGVFRFQNSSPQVRTRAAFLTILLMIYAGIGLSLNSTLTVRQGIVSGPVWPALGIIWVIPSQPWASHSLQRLLDLAGYVAIAPLAFLLFSAQRLLPEHRPDAGTLLIAGTGVTMFGLVFIYVQLNDTYVVALLPFLLLIVASILREGPSWKWSATTIAWSLLLLFGVLGLTRQNFDAQQRVWDAADEAVASGIPYDRVAGPKHWAEYHGAFDDWVAAGTPGLRPPPRILAIGEDPFHDPFYRWLHDRDARNMSGQ
ncbi:hypothetical protein [Sphingomonas sp. PvP056]|uniref:hypothetical protein n=1 Tax=Sphingomonas sp. PvP056 TaxID=3156392 RepID=UPI003392642B